MKNKNVSLPLGISAIEKKSAFVAKWLISAVKEGKWKVGDRLPPERAIAESLNVSRTAVREALSSLQMVGLVEPRVGDGNYVCGSIEAEININDALDALLESESLVEVWEVRKRVELILVKLAVDKASKDDLANIEECLLKAKETIEKHDPDEYLATNNDFHLAIAEAAKNPFLKRTLLPLLEITKQQLARAITKEYISIHAADLVQKHQAVFNALKNHDRANIVKIMRDHFSASEEIFLRDLQNERPG